MRKLVTGIYRMVSQKMAAIRNPFRPEEVEVSMELRGNRIVYKYTR